MADQQSAIDKFRQQVALLRVLQVLNCLVVAALLFMCFAFLPAKRIQMPQDGTQNIILFLCLIGLPASFVLVELRVRRARKKLTESKDGDSQSKDSDSQSKGSDSQSIAGDGQSIDSQS